MATSSGMNQVKSQTLPFEGPLQTVQNAIKLLVDFARESRYVSEMYALKNEFENTFSPQKSIYERIGNQLKIAVVTCNVPADKGKNVYYSARVIDYEKSESLVKETFLTNGLVPLTIYELSLITLSKMVLPDEDESKKHVADYIDQLTSMRLIDKIREKYIKDKDLVFSVMVNPVMMSKLEVMLLQDRNLEDVPGCRIQFLPGNKNYYSEGADDYWKKNWLTSVENFVVENYIKPQTCNEEIFHQVTVSNFNAVASADKTVSKSENSKEIKKRKTSDDNGDSETTAKKQKQTASQNEQLKSKKEKSKKSN